MRIDSAVSPYNQYRAGATGLSAGTATQHKAMAASTTIEDIAQAGSDIDDYFTPKAGIGLPPLLLPTPANIDALSRHASQKFKQLLADHNIPSAPSKITYGKDGAVQIPSDYPYGDALKQALADDPSMERELRTINALTSHFVATKPSLAFSREYTAAQSRTAVDAVLAKYSFLFSNNRPSADIALTFSPDGTLNPTANGKSYVGVDLSV